MENNNDQEFSDRVKLAIRNWTKSNLALLKQTFLDEFYTVVSNAEEYFRQAPKIKQIIREGLPANEQQFLQKSESSKGFYNTIKDI